LDGLYCLWQYTSSQSNYNNREKEHKIPES
jgi:hypothetical protein